MCSFFQGVAEEQFQKNSCHLKKYEEFVLPF